MTEHDLGPDTFGAALLAALEGRDARHAVERDDGRVDWADAAEYLAPPGEWREGTADALAAVRGRVLDVGCGAGRHAIYLRESGCEVSAFDPSPGAVEVCRRRRLPAVAGFLGDQALFAGEQFDGVVMLGNNLGLLAGPESAPRYLNWLAERCRPGAVLVGEALDTTRASSLEHLAYHRRARSLGRRPGEMRLRVVFEGEEGGWFPYWNLSPDELVEVAGDTPWTVQDVTGDELYMATLRLG
jgi:SAM-dependent methyltransferase